MSPALSTCRESRPEHSQSSIPKREWQDGFLALLPRIRDQARYAFRHLAEDAKDEAIQEVVANCLLAFRRLVEQGREEVATATSLAGYAVAHFRVGRQVATRMNGCDVTSPYCQRQHRVIVESLHWHEPQSNDWREIVLEDRRATPAETAVLRLDFEAWLESLSPRMRAIAEILATGETTGTVARLFKVSAARMSQIRRQLQEAWENFQGEALERAPLASG